MRKIKEIIIHCSATKEGHNFLSMNTRIYELMDSFNEKPS